MSLQLYDRVALRASFPEHALRAGDVATLVDFVDHPSSGPRGCVLELFNALGESIGVVKTRSSPCARTKSCRSVRWQSPGEPATPVRPGPAHSTSVQGSATSFRSLPPLVRT